MANIEKVLKDVVLGSVGAVAAVVEKGGELARTLVEKGQETVQNNQETVDNIRRKVRDVCGSVACNQQEDALPGGVEIRRCATGLQLTCAVEALSQEKADALRTLLEQADGQANESPLLLRLEGQCTGVHVTLDVAALPADRRAALRSLLGAADKPEAGTMA